ncbi:hypothetical protein RHMOL_Rhmol10G0100300 [Rhododendron molle]|uniref:Uncharacterized protein n=1 Tax=Rhododendron molle TaxID=49168 RepID=A0ACC0M1Z1_RHOML|nr:hypothetical protein RHMOL_Rhmol10G0100300 [Rhododendron molle]
MLVYAKCRSSSRPSFASLLIAPRGWPSGQGLCLKVCSLLLRGLSYSPDNHLLLFPWQSRKLKLERIRHCQCDVAALRLRMESKMLIYPKLASTGRDFKHSISWRTFAMPLSLEKESSSPEPENYSSNDEDAPKTSSEELLENPLCSDEVSFKIHLLLMLFYILRNRPILDSGHLNDEKVCCLMLDPNLESEPFDEEITLQVEMDSGNLNGANRESLSQLKALLADSERAKLIKKLSEANQQNRFLKRQLNIKEGALANFKTELAVSELEIQALVALAEEITKYGIPAGSRKINGKYIQSHLLSRLKGLVSFDYFSMIDLRFKAVDDKLKEHTKGVEAAQSKQVHLFWCGMAESVQVMGTFDGWSQGEHLSPEYSGSYTKFSTMLMLRPGRRKEEVHAKYKQYFCIIDTAYIYVLSNI